MTIWQMIKYMLAGIGITFELVPLAIVTTFIFGMILGILSFKRIPLMKYLLKLYNVVMRGLPTMVVLKLIYYNANFSSAYMAALISLTLYHGAYIGEIIRGCFETVPVGQMQAGLSLGLSYWKIMFKIYIPQILKPMIPMVCSQYILLVKDTTLVYIVGVMDMMWRGRQMMAMTFDPISGYLLIGVFYYILCTLIEILGRRVEKSISIKHRGRMLGTYYR